MLPLVLFKSSFYSRLVYIASIYTGNLTRLRRLTRLPRLIRQAKISRLTKLIIEYMTFV